MNIRLNGEKTMRKDVGETDFGLLHYRKMDVKIPRNSLLLCIKSLTNFYKINEHQTHARGYLNYIFFPNIFKMLCSLQVYLRNLCVI